MKGNGKEHGIVKWFNDAKGYGFIARDDGKPDVFVHYSDIQGSPGSRKTLREDQEVEFEVLQGAKGLKAVNVAASVIACHERNL